MTVTLENTRGGIRSLDELTKSKRATISILEGAEVVGIDRRTFSKAVENGEVPSIRLGRRILIPRLPFLHMLGVEATESKEVA